jgi:integrase
MDYHQGESRPTELPKWLDHYFATKDSFGITAPHLSKIVKQVASRRHDTIADNHEGTVERWLSNGKTEVPDIQFHDLRATWATQCLRAGVEDRQLMDWAGWKTIEMVQKYRSKLDDPSGRNRDAYRSGREAEGLSAQEKLAKLRKLGLIDDDENLSAEELAEVVKLLD